MALDVFKLELKANAKVGVRTRLRSTTSRSTAIAADFLRILLRKPGHSYRDEAAINILRGRCEELMRWVERPLDTTFAASPEESRQYSGAG